MLACEHRTSFASISRFGIDSASAPSVSTRLRLVWYAFAFCASGRRRTRPEYTDRAVVLDRALEQQVAAGVRRVVVLQRAEVEHLVAVAEVDRE